MKNNRARPSPKVFHGKHGNMELGETFWSDLISAEKPLIIVGPTSKSDKLDFITPLARALDAPIFS
ncbi:hypothetical protein [Rhodohalobacter sp.]|uniref:hypothetical protein n=1 Tax=Rhodohalobacter sp. TaxID=1974210 RepID=UPI002ACD6999|nr:hypothetical protein [Rhodohalobacter sp.]MDZ7756072.1 hypothetical protein [Rhodohalobacter sp.]